MVTGPLEKRQMRHFFFAGGSEMIIPAIEEGLTAITVIFHKPLAEWTADDQAVIIQRLREFFDRKTGKRRRRKARVPVRKEP
jgi:hypothetical protein